MDDVFAGKWLKLRGSIVEEWGKLTEDDLDKIQGKRDQLVGMLQKEYGYSQREAERRVDEFIKAH
jgi:uncharacterized protein YjbJ (UPF0337 family)